MLGAIEKFCSFPSNSLEASDGFVSVRSQDPYRYP
jgi:hypothetical protein